MTGSLGAGTCLNFHLPWGACCRVFCLFKQVPHNQVCSTFSSPNVTFLAPARSGPEPHRSKTHPQSPLIPFSVVHMGIDYNTEGVHMLHPLPTIIYTALAFCFYSSSSPLPSLSNGLFIASPNQHTSSVAPTIPEPLPSQCRGSAEILP